MLKKSILVVVTLLVLSVMLFFGLGPGFVERDMNKVVTLPQTTISPEAKALHQDLFIADWHADSILWARDLAKRADYGHVDLPRLQVGNVAIQMFTTVTKSPSGQNYETNETDANDNITKLALLQRWPVESWSSLTQRALFQAGKIHRLVEQKPEEVMLVRSQQELEMLLAKRRDNPQFVGAMLGTEGSHALDGKLSNIDLLYANGFRMMSLQHFFDNKLGGSLHGKSKAGLTEFGIQALTKMHEKSIIIDLSHSSENVVKDALALGIGPFVVSHTGFYGHCPTARNIPDGLMQQIALQGGLIAVGYWDGAVCDVTPGAIAKAIKYGIELVGEDHVALGSDYDGSVAVSFDTGNLVLLTDALIKEGLTVTQIEKVMGANTLAFLQENLPLQ